MHPILIRLGPITIYSYGVMVAVALIIGTYLARIEALRKNLNIDILYDVEFYVVLIGLVGARIYYLLFFNPQFIKEDFFEIFKIWRGGLSIHGAIIGGIVGGWIFARIRHISFWKLADIISPSLLLGQAIGRVGCFLNGCCFGKPTGFNFGVHFPEGSLPYIEYGKALVHPTQLYELVLDIVGFFILWSLRRKLSFEGGIFLVYLMLYNLIRILVSPFRGDNNFVYIFGNRIELVYIICSGIFIIALAIFLIKIVAKNSRS